MSARPIVVAFAFALVLMLAAAPQVLGDEITGTIKSVDRDRDTFVVTVGDADTEFEVDSGTTYESRRGDRLERDQALDVGNRVKVEFSGSAASRVVVVG